MIVFAFVLGTAGAIVLMVAGRLLWVSRPYIPGLCEMLSPDGDACTGTMAHIGWHHHQGKEWFGDAWQLPTNTVRAEPQPPPWSELLEDPNLVRTLHALIKKPVSRLPSRPKPENPRRWLIALGVLAAGFLIAVISALMQPSAPSKPVGHEYCVGDPNLGTPVCGNTDNCAMHFADATPGHMLCPDSPDQRPGTYIRIKK